MTDLFDAQRRAAAEESERAARARTRQATQEFQPPAIVFDGPCCGNCGHWRRKSAVLGRCRDKGWLTSYAARCPQHVPLPRKDSHG